MTTTSHNPETHPRHLVLVLGDQLDRDSAAFDGVDPEQDALWMAENAGEATHVWSHKLRLAFFFSAMRHFRDEQREAGRFVHYHELTHRPSDDRGRNFAEILIKDVHRLRPEKLILVQPGEFRVAVMLSDAAEDLNLPVEVRADRHFYLAPEDFGELTNRSKRPVMEYFYRNMRRKFDVLTTVDGKPEGGVWNFDKDNRRTFGKQGPPDIKPPRRFQPDGVTEDVIRMVERRFPDHPGSLEHFDLPVTHDQALAALRDFIDHRLPDFGTYEDAMWEGEPFLYHSRLSAPMNLKLLSPKHCVGRAVEAWRDGHAPLNSVEGFVRQILGWREFVRGLYWNLMPEYAEGNALRCGDRDVPSFFWNGETDMACVADVMRSLTDHAWTHHIPRLMVLGQFSMLLGVHPYKFHEWHMAMYADAVDWVSLPNALGMSQYGDGGVMGTKPYGASGNYIRKMGNHCEGCRYNPKHATGDDACPFTTLYWDFLDRHHKRFAGNHRMNFQMKNLERKNKEDLKEIRTRAGKLKTSIDNGTRI